MTNEAFEALSIARDAAHWAAVSAAAAWLFGLAGLVVTGGGLWFVWHQLRATEAAANAAWMTARPWLSFELQAEANTTLTKRTGHEGTHLSLTIKVENVGRAPALDISVSGGATTEAAWAVEPGVLAPSTREPLALGALTPGASIEYVFHVDWFDNWERDTLAGVRCEYAVPGLAGRRLTSHAFDVFRPARSPVALAKYDGNDYETRVAHVTKLRQYRAIMT